MPRSREEKERHIKSFKVDDKVSFGMIWSEYPKDGTTEVEGVIVDFIDNDYCFIKTKYGILKERILYLTHKENIMDKIIYTRFGRQYAKLERNQTIKEDAMESWEYGELQPIINTVGGPIGSTPADFSDERDFYNPIEG